VNTATKITELPALTADLLQSNSCLVDNLFADLWKQMGMKALLNKAGFSKRSGAPIYELVYVLVLWVWLKKDSIGMLVINNKLCINHIHFQFITS
jgi:hypothetical protein